MKIHVERFFPKYKNVIILSFIWIAVTIFNITKSVHMDDSFYIRVAQNIMHDPIHPLSQYVSEGGVKAPGYVTFHPIGLPFILALTMKVFGQVEMALHIVQSIFSFLCIIAFYLLVKQINFRLAFLFTALFAVSPAFIPAQNLMLDIPALSFTLLTFVYLINFSSALSIKKRYFLAGLFIGIGSLIKYSNLLLIPLFILTVALHKSWKYLVYLMIPIGMLMLWSLFNLYDFGKIHLLASEKTFIELSVKAISSRFILWSIAIGAVSFFSYVGIPSLVKTKLGKLIFTGAVFISLIYGIGHWNQTGDTFFNPILRLIFFFNGSLVFGEVLNFLLQLLIEYRKTKNNTAEFKTKLMLTIWFFSFNIYMFIVAPFVAIRYILPSIAAYLLILGYNLRETFSKRLVAPTFIISITLGLALGLSDWKYADLYRQFPRILESKINKSHMEDRPRIWYAGSMDFQWYAQKYGFMEYFPNKSLLSDGDYLVVPSIMKRSDLITLGDKQHMEKIDTITVLNKTSTYIRLVSDYPHSIAGYQGYFWEYQLPWIISAAPLEQFTIFRVNKATAVN